MTDAASELERKIEGGLVGQLFVNDRLEVLERLRTIGARRVLPVTMLPAVTPVPHRIEMASPAPLPVIR